MRKGFIACAGLLLALFFSTCIRNVDPPIRQVPPSLVAEGWITTDSPPYTVNLSYSGQFSNAFLVPQDLYIKDARVVILDDLGDSTDCKWTENGSYQSADSNFVGQLGRTYTLKIYLSNGKTYISQPETITPVPTIDSISITYDSTLITDIRPNQLIISVNTHDPAGIRNFYRWTASGYIPRKSVGDSCRLFAMACTDPYFCTCGAFCEQFLADNQLNVFSDQYTDGKEIVQQPVFYSPLYWFGKHFIEIKQYSISGPVYGFWQQFLNQSNRTGSILDPLPAPLNGNIHGLTDPTDIALGIFSASAVFTKKITIIPFALQKYWLESTAGQFIKDGDCHFEYANSLGDDTDAPGWETAQQIDYY
jgi:hypothetical protein